MVRKAVSSCDWQKRQRLARAWGRLIYDLRSRFLCLASACAVLATCGGCIYGARALRREAKKLSALQKNAEVIIVWIAMLESDNEDEARIASVVRSPG